MYPGKTWLKKYWISTASLYIKSINIKDKISSSLDKKSTVLLTIVNMDQPAIPKWAVLQDSDQAFITGPSITGLSITGPSFAMQMLLTVLIHCFLERLFWWATTLLFWQKYVFLGMIKNGSASNWSNDCSHARIVTLNKINRFKLPSQISYFLVWKTQFI